MKNSLVALVLLASFLALPVRAGDVSAVLTDKVPAAGKKPAPAKQAKKAKKAKKAKAGQVSGGSGVRQNPQPAK